MISSPDLASVGRQGARDDAGSISARHQVFTFITILIILIILIIITILIILFILFILISELWESCQFCCSPQLCCHLLHPHHHYSHTYQHNDQDQSLASSTVCSPECPDYESSDYAPVSTGVQ